MNELIAALFIVYVVLYWVFPGMLFDDPQQNPATDNWVNQVEYAHKVTFVYIIFAGIIIGAFKLITFMLDLFL